MAISDILQIIADARVDARSLSDFVFKPSGFKVPRRLAPPIDTLQFYIDRFDATKATTDAYIATIPGIVNDAINNTAVDGGVLADTFVTMTANGAGSVPRNLRDVNSDITNLLNFIPPSEMAAIQNRTSTYDCSAALAAAVATGKRVIIPTAGTYKLITGYSGTSDFDVEATTSGVVFDFNNSTADYPLSNTGSLTKLELAFTAPKKSEFKVVFTDVTGINIDDWLCFYCPTDRSYSQMRINYRAGEWVKVRDIKGSTVYFEKPFSDSLEGLSLDLYKLNSVVCRIANFKIVRKDSQAGIVNFALSSDASDNNITIDAITNSAIIYDRCTNPTSYNAKGKNKGRGTDDYAISMGNSQSGRVYNADVYSRRHAIALGGGNAICSVPVDNFRCYDSVLKCDPEALVGAADMHGNVRNSSYEDCVIYGGSNIGGGDNNWYKGCEIYSDATGVVGFGREILGGNFGWVDCVIHINGSARASTRGVFDFGSNSIVLSENTTKDVLVEFKNITIASSSGTDTSIGENFVSCVTRGSDVNVDITIDGLTCADTSPLFLAVLSVSAAVADIETGTIDTVLKSKGMVVDNIKNINAKGFFRSVDRGVGTYIDVPLRMMHQSIKSSAVVAVGAAEVLTSRVTYPIAYPRTPNILSNIDSVGTASAYNSVGGAPVYNLNSLNNATDTRIKLVLPLTNKFTVADTLTVSYVVGLDEI